MRVHICKMLECSAIFRYYVSSTTNSWLGQGDQKMSWKIHGLKTKKNHFIIYILFVSIQDSK